MSQPLFDIIDRMEQDAHSPRLHLVFSGPPVTGAELKDEAFLKVQRKQLARDYRDKLIEGLKLFPVRSLITIEQLRGVIGDPPEGVSPNIMGAIVNVMAKRGLIEKTGRMIQALRPSLHQSELAEWRVCKYD